MKQFTTNERTGKIITVRDEGGKYLYRYYETIKIEGVIKEASDILKHFKPRILSDSLLKAINNAFESNGSCTFNYGRGNQTFYFKEHNQINLCQ